MWCYGRCERPSLAWVVAALPVPLSEACSVPVTDGPAPSLLLCPSEDSKQRPADPWGTLNYVGNYGGPGAMKGFTGTMIPLYTADPAGATSWENDASTRAETDAFKSFSNTITMQDDFVPVRQKGSSFPIRKCQRFRAQPSKFQKAATILLLRPGNCATANQVTRTQRASVRGVMSNHLRKCPIHASKG